MNCLSDTAVRGAPRSGFFDLSFWTLRVDCPPAIFRLPANSASTASALRPSRSSAAVRSCDHPALLDLSASQHRSRAASEAVRPCGRPTSLEPFNLSIARFSRSAAFESDRPFNRSAPPALDLCNRAIFRPHSSIDLSPLYAFDLSTVRTPRLKSLQPVDLATSRLQRLIFVAARSFDRSTPSTIRSHCTGLVPASTFRSQRLRRSSSR